VVLERSREFRGRYHVLGGAISPIDGIGPERLRFKELVDRVRGEAIDEVIIATNPTFSRAQVAKASFLPLKALLSHVHLVSNELRTHHFGSHLNYRSIMCAYSDVVREAQEIVELALKGMLRQIGIEPHLPLLGIILPIGISFYTFKTMSYTIDVYKNKIVRQVG
jgi:D-alanyl-lipoteichoic acid acyltransferase DltB (MBOAT superfamily)